MKAYVGKTYCNLWLTDFAMYMLKITFAKKIYTLYISDTLYIYRGKMYKYTTKWNREINQLCFAAIPIYNTKSIFNKNYKAVLSNLLTNTDTLDAIYSRNAKFAWFAPHDEWTLSWSNNFSVTVKITDCCVERYISWFLTQQTHILNKDWLLS